MSGGSPAWPAERVARLKELIAEGKTFSAIGEELGISKNAAIGKADRIAAAERTAAGVTPLEIPQAKITPRFDFPPAGGCIWPLGHPGEDGFRFCAAPVALTGAPYCDQHLQRAYARAPAKGGGDG